MNQSTECHTVSPTTWKIFNVDILYIKNNKKKFDNVNVGGEKKYFHIKCLLDILSQRIWGEWSLTKRSLLIIDISNIHI